MDAEIVKDLSRRFCYYNSLEYTHPDLYGDIKGEFDSIAAQLTVQESDSQTDEIDNAIKFLQNAAKSEKLKEIKVIRKFVDDISKQIKSLSLKKEDRNRIDKLLNNIKASTNITEALPMEYKDLILLINIAKKNSEQYQKRLKRLLDNYKANKKNYQGQLQVIEGIQTRIAADVNRLLTDFYRKRQTQTKDELYNKVREKINGLVESLSNKIDITDFPAIIELIVLDLYKFLQQYYDDDIKDFKQKISDYVDKYFEESQLIKRIQEKNIADDNELQKLLELAKSTIGYQFLEDTGVADYKKFSETLGKKRIIVAPDRIIMKLNKKDNGITPIVTWNIMGQQNIHGFLAEVGEALSSAGGKIKGSPATDVVTVDYFSANIKIELSREDYLDSIQSSLEQIGIIQGKRSTETRMKSHIADLQEEQKKLKLIEQSITHQLQNSSFEQKQDFFIYHESLKFYQGIESAKATSFHGRALNIINALDSLYAAEGMSNSFQLIDQKLLYSIIMNLSDFAIASAHKPTVENYLSIFAGLLMFDDIANIAIDAAEYANNKITNEAGQAYSIHLYMVNGIYVPGSYLLSSIAEVISNHEIIRGNAKAHAIIDTPAFDNKEKNKKFKQIAVDTGSKQYNQFNESEWKKASEAVAKNTKIKIVFLTNFFQFLKDINSVFE